MPKKFNTAKYLRNCIFNVHYNDQSITKMSPADQSVVVNQRRIKNLQSKMLKNQSDVQSQD